LGEFEFRFRFNLVEFKVGLVELGEFEFDLNWVDLNLI
jgi:hypothetical protein